MTRMTIYDYAVYRHAFDLMTAEERAAALDLAQRADRGERHAGESFRDLADRVILREAANAGEKKAA